ncbi:MAG: ribosome silencing factor [Planctomycetota bacterium]
MADSKKAKDIIVLNVSRTFMIADYFVVCGSGSSVQSKSIADEIEEELKESGITILGREGSGDSAWILLDFGSVIVHIFRDWSRRFYDIENFWGDSHSIQWKRSTQKKKRTKST